jgi:thymidine phosphorylase
MRVATLLRWSGGEGENNHSSSVFCLISCQGLSVTKEYGQPMGKVAGKVQKLRVLAGGKTAPAPYRVSRAIEARRQGADRPRESDEG